MNRMNLGCADDIKSGWVNADSKYRANIVVWDARNKALPQHLEQFDFVLVNHVLCTMIPSDAIKVLANIHSILKPGGTVQIIDMDLLKAFGEYWYGEQDFPIKDGSPEYNLCMHISGYGTRLSLYTDGHLQELLCQVGFKTTVGLDYSEYDTRPKESLIVEAIK